MCAVQEYSFQDLLGLKGSAAISRTVRRHWARCATACAASRVGVPQVTIKAPLAHVYAQITAMQPVRVAGPTCSAPRPLG
jgi:hypothetical protein